MLRGFIEGVIVTCIVLTLMAGVAVSAVKWLSLPSVELNPEGKCVGVISLDKQHSCLNLPEKYTHQYVKGE